MTVYTVLFTPSPSDQHLRLKDAEAATDVKNDTHYR